MKCVLLFLPLLGLAPLGYFLGSYLDGAGILPRSSGFLISAASMFLLPWVIAALFLTIRKGAPSLRTSLFICALLVQAVLLFTVVPPAATSEMMGIAHRLRGEFSPEELRGCADHLRQKFHDGTLEASVRNKDDHYIVAPSAVVVADGELPNSLRGRFQRVFIQKATYTGEEQVVFALGQDRGIICDDRKDVHEFFIYSIADGVEAYRYERL